MGASGEERELVQLIRERDFHRAATEALSRYGAEVYGFLINLMGNESDASEVFSQTAEDLWRGLPSFRAQCSLRSWLYLLSRHAAARFRRTPWNRRGRTGDTALDELVMRSRTTTSPWQRSDVKDRWRDLRESLEADDRTLLVLRVDRGMSWTEVAQIMVGREDPEGAELKREATRLRKRYQLLKEKLRRRAREMGLVDR